MASRIAAHRLRPRPSLAAAARARYNSPVPIAAPIPTEPGLIFAGALDGHGGMRSLGWAEVHAWKPADGPLWVHLDLNDPIARAWVESSAGLESWAADALLAETTRPRADVHGDGILAVFRGANFNPGAEPDDMISIRTWIDPARFITIRAQVLQSIQEVRSALERRQGPVRIGELPLALLDSLAARARDVVEEIADDLEKLEDSGRSRADLAGPLSDIRRRCMHMAMHMRPQREAIRNLARANVAWLTDDDRATLQQVEHRFARLLDDIDAARDHAILLDNEMRAITDERLSRRLYLLSIVSAVFLPLMFLTGLFGMNVPGIPLSSSPAGFAVLCIISAAVGAGVMLLLKRFRWF